MTVIEDNSIVRSFESINVPKHSMEVLNNSIDGFSKASMIGVKTAEVY